ncbi:hypothetical protein Aperf_G00000059754 [Anoplocephala perfoliata]
MQRNASGVTWISTGGGGVHRKDAYEMSNSQNSMGFLSPLRVSSTNDGTLSRVTNSASSSGKPLSPIVRSDRPFPRSSIKHVRYDSRGPTSLEDTWHSRSSSEHSYLNQNSRLQVDSSDSHTAFTSPPPTSNLHQDEFVPTPTGRSNEHLIEPQKRRISIPNVLNQASKVSTMAGNMFSQLSAMAQRTPAAKSTTVPRRGSNFNSAGKTFQKMNINGVEQSELFSNKETIKQRLLEDYQFNRMKEPDKPDASSKSTSHHHYPTPPYYNELTRFHAEKAEATNTVGRKQHSRLEVRRKSGTIVIPSRSADDCMTRSEYNDRIMDYRGNSTVTMTPMIGTGSAFNDYPSSSTSAMISPTGVRGSARSVSQPSPSSVIEELQGRFQNSARPREKRPILKNAPVNSDYVPSVYHRRTATAVSSTSTALASRPHHRSELALPTTTSAEMSFEPPSRTINTASAIRSEPNGTLRTADSSAFRGGPSFRRLQTLYGTNVNQKRYPSDNALDMSYSEEKTQQPSSLMPQFYVSGRKAGTVKIAVRSRSEQASPTNELASPRQIFKAAASGTAGGVTFDDRVRSEQVIVPRTAQLKNNATSLPNGPQDDENLALPSVREIIRQVEEMTLKNNSSTHNSTTSLAHSHSGGSVPHISRSLSRPLNLKVHGGAGTGNRSLSASSTQINGGTLGRLHNHNGTYYAATSNPNDYDSHTVGRGYATIRGSDFDSDGQRNAGTSAVHNARKGEMIANLPQDYQKLLEAFLEQRKEIQRMRKEMVDKDRLIASLQKDIHLYEPWR